MLGDRRAATSAELSDRSRVEYRDTSQKNGRRRSRSQTRRHRDDRPRGHASADADGYGRHHDWVHKSEKHARRSRSSGSGHISDRAERRPRRRVESPPRRREKERRGGRDRSRSREIQDRDSHNTRRRNRVDVGRDRGHHRSQRHPHSRSRSPHQKRRRRSPSSSRSPSPPPRSRKPLPDQVAAFQGETSTDVAPPVEKEKPNFANTGLLAKESNTVAGTNITLKYHEPPNARKPPASAPWRMYVFKGADLLDTIPLGERTCWLFGREQKVADIFLEHPSNSGQHAVLQFRYVQRKKMDELGFEKMEGRVKPYLMDLESRNGTSLNEEKIGAAKYVELRDGDLVRFGESEREYVLQLPPKDAL